MTALNLDRPAEVRKGEELDLERLSRYLARELPELAASKSELQVRQFPSGFSNLTYLIELADLELVLRRPPFGAQIKTAHDMGREYRILSALAPSYRKVPKTLLYCEDPEVLGAPFYLMERVQGVVLRPRMKPEDAPDTGTMAQIAAALVDTLSELHAVDFEGVGLGDLGKPQGYVRRQIEGWTRRYVAAKTDEIADIESVAAWLAGHMPEESGAALIHNDFKYDNLVLDSRDPSRVVAVLDWEMATLGDPLMDLGTSLGYWVDPDDPPEMLELRLSPTTIPGNLSRLEVAERYAEVTGRALDDLVFYYVYGLFKIAVIVQQIYARYQRGDTRDPRFASLIEGVRLCGLVARQAIARGRIDRLFPELIEPMPEIVTREELLGRKGWVSPYSEAFVIDQDRIDDFAEATEDRQFIHCDPERAARTPFGGTIAHGFLSLSLLPYLVDGISMIPEGTVMAINYGLDKVRFLEPVRAGSRVRARIEILDVVEKERGRLLVSARATVEIVGRDKPVLVAETLSMFVTR